MSEEDDVGLKFNALVSINLGEHAGKAIDRASQSEWAGELSRMLANLFGMGADGLQHRRARRLRALEEETQKELAARGVSPKQLDDALALEVVSGATTSDDPVLRRLWARLLASAHEGLAVDPFLASLLNRLDPSCAIVFERIGQLFEQEEKQKYIGLIERSLEKLGSGREDQQRRETLEENISFYRSKSLAGHEVGTWALTRLEEPSLGDIELALEKLTVVRLLEPVISTEVITDPYRTQEYQQIEVNVGHKPDTRRVTRLGGLLWSAIRNHSEDDE